MNLFILLIQNCLLNKHLYSKKEDKQKPIVFRHNGISGSLTLYCIERRRCFHQYRVSARDTFVEKRQFAKATCKHNKTRYFQYRSYNREHMLGYKPDWTHLSHILYFPSSGAIWQHLNWVADIENIYSFYWNCKFALHVGLFYQCNSLTHIYCNILFDLHVTTRTAITVKSYI